LNNAASYISAYFLSQLLALPVEETEQAVETGEAVGGPIVEIMAMIIIVGIFLTIFGVALYGLVGGIRKINKDNPIDWSEKSEKVTSAKTRLATAAAIFIGIGMTALTIILRMI
jgi:heme/copper-type cytochrome/quinol oxidase subunit 1